MLSLLVLNLNLLIELKEYLIGSSLKLLVWKSTGLWKMILYLNHGQADIER